MSVRAWLATPSTGRDVGILSAAVVLFYLLCGGHPAFGSSTRYVEACREMVELGQWSVPHLGYVPYFEKPILTYWLGAAAQWLFGGGDLAAQAPSGLAALVSVLATYALGRRLRDAAFGLAAGLLLLSSGVFLVMASTLTTDPLIAACLAVVWWTWWCWEDGRDRAAGAPPGNDRWLWGFWAALGLGLLAKGPIAIVLAGMAIGGHALLSGGLRGVGTTLWAMHPLRGVLVLLLVNLPWSWVVWQRDPRFLEFFYVRINYDAFFDPSVNHPGPWWFYGPLVLAYLAPFTVPGIPALAVGLWRAFAPAARGWRWWGDLELTREQRGRLFLASVVVFPLLFLSVSTSKLGTYLLPLLPALLLLTLDVLWDWRGRPMRWYAGLLAVLGTLLAVALMVTPWAIAQAHAEAAAGQAVTLTIAGHAFPLLDADTSGLSTVDWAWMPLAQAALLLVVIGLWLAAVAAWRGRLLGSLAALGGALTLAVLLLMPRVALVVPDFNSARLGVLARTLAAPADQLIIQQELVHEYEIIHAIGRRLAITGNAREIGMGHFTEVTPPSVPLPKDPYHVNGELLPGHPWLYSAARLRAEWGGPRRLWLLASEEFVAQLRASGLPCQVLLTVRGDCLVSDRQDPRR